MQVGDLVKYSCYRGIILKQHESDFSLPEVQCLWDDGSVSWVLKKHCEVIPCK